MPTGVRFPLDVVAEAIGYSDTYEETRSKVNMEVGPPRMRNLVTIAPRVFKVRWTLSQEEYEIFGAWWVSIKFSELPFDVLLLDDTEDLMWHTCQWMAGTYNAARDYARNEWIVDGTLRSIAEPFAVRPSLTDELFGLTTLEMGNTGAMLIRKVLWGRSILELNAWGRLAPIPFKGRSNMTLVAHGYLYIPNFRLRMDGSQRLREDGSFRERESN